MNGFNNNNKIIIVNGMPHPFEGEIGYETVVTFAYGTYDSNLVYTVLYYAGKSDHIKGSLVKGQTIMVHPGMVFNVTKTIVS